MSSSDLSTTCSHEVEASGQEVEEDEALRLLEKEREHEDQLHHREELERHEHEEEGTEEVEEEVVEVLDNVPQHIMDGVYIGSVDAVENLPVLECLQISAILNATREIARSTPSNV